MLSKKILAIIISVGLLGIIITTFSLYHAQHLGGAYPQFPLFLYSTSILSFILGGFVFYLYENRIDRKSFERFISVLPRDERILLKEIQERREIEQNKLVTLTGLSRVKVSRTLKDFEQRGFIEKKKHGYTNLIIYKL